MGDFGRYAPGEEMGVTTLQHYKGVMPVMGVMDVTPVFPFTFSFTEYLSKVGSGGGALRHTHFSCSQRLNHYFVIASECNERGNLVVDKK